MRGTATMLFEGFTFTLGGSTATNTYYCTKRHAGCKKARVHLYHDGTVKDFISEHNHEPPQLVISNGMFIKVNRKLNQR